MIIIIVVFYWTCQTSLEAFEDVKMRPWFGYEPGRYGQGWNRSGCVNLNPSCVMV